MQDRLPDPGPGVSASGLLGYLNFSDGRSDARWQKQFNDAYAAFAAQGVARPWEALLQWLQASLPRLRESGGAAFSDIRQAATVLDRVTEFLPVYRAYHADLLGHQEERDLFAPFFLVRVFEAVLIQGVADDDDSWRDSVLTRLNDFVGHRPVALFESRPQGEPYPHEKHRPVPLLLKGAGIGYGRYSRLITLALEILGQSDPEVRADAGLDLALLDELAVDMRAYDQVHPVNRRPNYVFGEWDPSHLDNQGRFRRYVVRQITLDALLDRIERNTTLDKDELYNEAATVLAGTILMAVGVSGPSPTAYDSTVTLATLMPRIARYRDRFYDKLLSHKQGPHATRLFEEKKNTRQPFGGARQHLNAYLARHRATQLQYRCLSLLFAEIGYPETSREESRRIPAVSTRLLSEVASRVSTGLVMVEHGSTEAASRLLPEIADLLKRGVECGAFADPWNILGFQGLFPLSAAREDSVRDPRLDELAHLVEQSFNLALHLISEAAASGDESLIRDVIGQMEHLATWWDRYATADVSEVRRVSGAESVAAGTAVGNALTSWHARGEAPADLAFWRRHLDELTTPKAYALVVDTLLRKLDYRASMALLTSWLGRADDVPLEDAVGLGSGAPRLPHREGAYSFHTLSLRWILALTADGVDSKAADAEREAGARQRRELLIKFFDHLEANAEEYWQVPALTSASDDEEIDEDDDEKEDIYEAAYEKFTYRDSADDGEEGAVSDGGSTEAFDLEHEGDRLEKRLRFLSTLARLWKIAGRYLISEDRNLVPENWLRNARANQQRLMQLLDTIFVRELPEPTGGYDSLVEYDRRRVVKDQLLYAAIGTCLDTAFAVNALDDEDNETGTPSVRPWNSYAVKLERALFRGATDEVKSLLPKFFATFQSEPLLMTPFNEGGKPRDVLRVRLAQSVLRELLANLPRAGILRESFEVLRSARAMEQSRPTRGKGVTEFNHFFQTAYQEVAESLVLASSSWPEEHATEPSLVVILEKVTAPFLSLWIEHSRTLQLSNLEAITSDSDWSQLQAFVRRYGRDLFHARFMTLANLRGVLHRGARNYLEYLQDNQDPLHPIRLLSELGKAISLDDAVKRLEIVLHAIIENYEEFKDYNTTTTQSDYGENLHVLLDFLRIKVAYERHAWQFRPLILAHEVLARCGRAEAAALWEKSFAQLTASLSRQHLDSLANLESIHGVKLSTIADRLNERFLKPLALDRLCALIEPSVHQASEGEASEAVARLKKELEVYSAAPTGVGLDVPAWLRRLEAELHRVKAMQTNLGVLAEGFFRVPRRPLDFEDVMRQLREKDFPALPG